MNLIPHPSDGWLPFLEVFPDAEDFYPATVHCGGETVTLRELFIAPRALERLLKLGVRG